jgi:CRISPR-associated exonuclease Cas4
MTPLIITSIIALLAGCALWLFARKRAENLDLPGDLVYVDDDDDKLLVSDHFGLTGRPDYILKAEGEFIPVERKSRNISRSGPYAGEVLQLAAYCLLVEEKYQRPVHHGRLQYLNRSVDVPFDLLLRERLMMALDALDNATSLRDVPPSHSNPARCRACGFRERCDQALP